MLDLRATSRRQMSSRQLAHMKTRYLALGRSDNIRYTI